MLTSSHSPGRDKSCVVEGQSFGEEQIHSGPSHQSVEEINISTVWFAQVARSAGLSQVRTSFQAVGDVKFWISLTRFVMNISRLLLLSAGALIQLIAMVESLQPQTYSKTSAEDNS